MNIFRKLRYRKVKFLITYFLVCCLFFNVPLSVVLADVALTDVVNGNITVNTGGNTTNMTASDGAIGQFSDFDIASNQSVICTQPNAAARALFEVFSGDGTQIYGRFEATGSVYLHDAAGILIGPGAVINMNQFVASSLGISHEDFLNGQDIFAGGNAAVINQGNISAEKVALIGKKVLNTGTITSPNGYVVMAAGDKVVLSQPGSNVIVELASVDVSAGADAAAADMAEVTNEGTIDAQDGMIVLAAGDIFSKALNLGTLSAEGGTVSAKAARVGQFGNINTDSSEGDGGSVNLTATEVVALGHDSVTTANAGTNGDGGEVIVYSPDTALFRSGAKIEVKGGAESGNGGFVEISGRKHVEVQGTADRTAANGENGMLLIDPTNILITDNDVDDPGWTDDDFAPTTTGSEIDIDTLEGHLALGDTTISTTSDLSEEGNVTFAAKRLLRDGPGGGSGNSLTVNAEGDINLKNNSGINLTGGGGAELNAGGTVNLSANIWADDVTINADVEVYGSYNRRIDAGTGTLTVSGDISKEGDGKLTLAGNSGINLAGDITGEATNSIVLENTVYANGGGDQNFDAQTGILWAKGDINKNTPGNLALAGASVALDGNVDVDNNLDLNGSVFVAGDKTLAAGGNLHADSALSGSGNLNVSADNIALDDEVSAAGNLTLTGAGDVDVQGDITTTNGGNIDIYSSDNTTHLSGYLVQADGDITLHNNTELDRSGTQKIDAAGRLTADGNITKTTNGMMMLRGRSNGIDLNGNVDSEAGSLMIMDEFTAAGDLRADDYLEMFKAGGFDGADQSVHSESSYVAAHQTLTKTTTGDLEITVGSGGPEYFRQITLDGDVTVNDGSLIVGGIEEIQAGQGDESMPDLYVYADLSATEDVSIFADTEFYGGFYTRETVDQSVEAQSGKLATYGSLHKTTPGDLTLKSGYDGSAQDAIDLNYAGPGNGVSTSAGNIIIEGKGDIQIGVDLITTLNSPTGDIYKEPGTGEPGGVSIISTNGKIYTETAEDDSLNVTIEGYSDHATDTGVDLPYGEGKAAIVVMSKEDLKLGEDNFLNAEGIYYGDEVDDRPGVGFLAEAANIGGHDRDQGLPMDVAIYAASTEGNVEAKGGMAVTFPFPKNAEAAELTTGATTVLDAYDTVSFTIEAIKPFPAATFNLEVSSRKTEWLNDAVDNATLPYADDPEFMDTVLGDNYDYVLRGAGLDNTEIQDGRAWVLENPEEKPPEPPHLDAIAYYEDRPPFELTEECPALMAWATEELELEGGIQGYLAGAYVYTTDLQACEMCARLRDAATILADEDGAQIAALGTVINEFVAPPMPISAEQMASIGQALALHTDDGTHYAAAGQWLDSLVEYIGILNSEIGWSMAESVAFATTKYAAPATAEADVTVMAYIETQLSALGG
ncbi:MAG: filamentous hemagglutinin N-terminal domain-containing protein [Planctomycetota bacterium]